MDTVARRIVVRGRVQRVFFRVNTRQQAQARGVTGWVRNRDDGTVEVVAEGVPTSVEALIAWLHHGPPEARVDAVEAHEAEVTGYGSFEVR